MNNSAYKIIKLIAPVLLLAMAIGSCKKDSDPSNELVRQFMPIDISVTTGDTIATLSWKPSLYTSGKDVEYTLELSRDSNFTAAAEFSVVTKNTQVTITDRQLAVRQKYFGRIKTNAYGNSEESHWYHSNGMTPLRGEQFMRPILDGELTDSKVTLRWVVNAGVTKITLTPTTGNPISVNLDPADIAAGVKTITNLAPKTTYDAAIFVGPAQKGFLTFTSFASTPTGSNIIMVGATDDLVTLLQTPVAAGTVFVLQQGTKYTSGNTVQLPNNASITIWGQPGPNKPIIAVKEFSMPTNGGAIKFENLDLTGYPNNDPTQTKRSYFVNQSAASVTAELIFENCTLRNFANTVMRLQTATTTVYDKVTFNKCIVSDIGWPTSSYAFIHNTIAAKINNIYITNNTFSNVGFGLITHNVSTSNTVQVDNNTFYNVTGDGRLMIDYKTLVINNFTFLNNVVGKTASPLGTAKGVVAGSAPTVGSNTYKTSDAVFAGNPFSNIIDYGKASTDLFVDPAAGNFIFKDVNFAGRSTSGDPRWRY